MSSENPAPTASAELPPTFQPQVLDENAKYRERLAMVIPSLDFTELPFERAIDFLRIFADLSIFVDWNAMKAQGVGPDTSVTLEAKNVPLRKLLDLLLESVSASGSSLDWVMDEGVLLISTREDLDQVWSVQFLDISDLLSQRRPNVLAQSIGTADLARSQPMPRDERARRLVADLNSILLEFMDGLPRRIEIHGSKLHLGLSRSDAKLIEGCLAQLREERARSFVRVGVAVADVDGAGVPLFGDLSAKEVRRRLSAPRGVRPIRMGEEEGVAGDVIASRRAGDAAYELAVVPLGQADGRLEMEVVIYTGAAADDAGLQTYRFTLEPGAAKLIGVPVEGRRTVLAVWNPMTAPAEE